MRASLLSHVWWRNYITSHLGLEPDIERGSCDWCPLQNQERSLVPGCQKSLKSPRGEGWDMIVGDLRVKFLTYVTARDGDRRGRQLRHWLLATWRARSGGDDVRKVVHLPPLRLYSAWLGGGHAAAAPALNTNGMLDTSKWLREAVLIPLKWGLNQHAWQVPESRKGIQHGGRQLNTHGTKLRGLMVSNSGGVISSEFLLLFISIRGSWSLTGLLQVLSCLLCH